MSPEVTVHLPGRVWAAILDYEPPGPPFGLAPTLRQCLRDAVEVRQERPVLTVFRIATMTAEDAEALENWLSEVSTRRDAPRESRAALELVREGRRLSS